jgi:hypothetical protein
LSQILTLIINFVFPNIKAYNPLKVNRRFEGTYCLYLQGRRINHLRNQHEAIIKQSNRCINMKKYILFFLHMCHMYHILSIPSNVRLGVCYVLKTSTTCEAGFQGLNADLNIEVIRKIIICVTRFPVFSLPIS